MSYFKTEVVYRFEARNLSVDEYTRLINMIAVVHPTTERTVAGPIPDTDMFQYTTFTDQPGLNVFKEFCDEYNIKRHRNRQS